MSYTESDVIEHIFEDIKNDLGIYTIINNLISWYKHQKSVDEVNGWNTKSLDEKIKFLESKQR